MTPETYRTGDVQYGHGLRRDSQDTGQVTGWVLIAEVVLVQSPPCCVPVLKSVSGSPGWYFDTMAEDERRPPSSRLSNLPTSTAKKSGLRILLAFLST